MILNLFRTSFLCIIMLQFKLNHKRTRVLTHVKDRKHLSSKCICCLSIVLNIRFYIYKMVLYYYNTIFQKNTMSYQKSSLVWGGWGNFPSFIHELFCHIWLGSNRMQLRFLEGQKNCISACCYDWMKGTIYVFSLSCVSFGVFSAQKNIIQLNIEMIGSCKMWLIQMSLHSESCHSSKKVSLL